MLRFATLLLSLTALVCRTAGQEDSCNCEAAAGCIQGKITEAFKNLRYLTLSDIPEKCRNEANAPAELTELQTKMKTCIDAETPGGLKDVELKGEMAEKLQCVKQKLLEGCEAPSTPAKVFSRLLGDRIADVPIPGCDGPENPTIIEKLSRMDKCDIKNKLEQMRDHFQQKFPTLSGFVKCLKEQSCGKTRQAIGNVREECVQKNGCKAVNMLGAIIGAKECRRGGPSQKMKEKFARLCGCISEKLGFDADAKDNLCSFPENC